MLQQRLLGRVSLRCFASLSRASRNPPHLPSNTSADISIPTTFLKHNMHPTHSSMRSLVKGSASMSSLSVDTSDDDGTVKTPLSIAVFSATDYVRQFAVEPLSRAFSDVRFTDARLNMSTVELARGSDAICIFVNDQCGADVIEKLSELGVKYIALRCAGFDRVDINAAQAKGIKVVRVPTYSPRSVAEMALTLIMACARNLILAHDKARFGNYELSGLVGSEVSYKKYGIVGTGNIGIELIKLLKGFDGEVLAYDVRENPEAIAHGAKYVDLDTLLRESDFVSLHVPLLPSTYHLMNTEKLKLMKPDAYLINVSRGGLIDTTELISMLSSGDDGLQENGGKLAGVALDVYEREESLFFQDFSNMPVKDRMRTWDHSFTMLKNLPQVLVTPHVAFLTHEALKNIADTTIENLKACHAGEPLKNEVVPRK